MKVNPRYRRKTPYEEANPENAYMLAMVNLSRSGIAQVAGSACRLLYALLELANRWRSTIGLSARLEVSDGMLAHMTNSSKRSIRRWRNILYTLELIHVERLGSGRHRTVYKLPMTTLKSPRKEYLDKIADLKRTALSAGWRSVAEDMRTREKNLSDAE